MRAVFDYSAFLIYLQRIQRFFLVLSSITGRAWSQYLNKGKTPSIQGLFNGFGKIPRVQNGPPGHVGCARCKGQKGKAERLVRIAARSGCCFGHAGGGGCRLAAGHAVDQVVHADHRDIHVAPGRMDEVIAADGEKIAVPAEYHHVKLRIGQLHAGCKGNGPAVSGMIGIKPGISGATARTSYAGNHHRLIQINATGLHGDHTRGKRRSYTTSRTPDVGNAVCS